MRRSIRSRRSGIGVAEFIAGASHYNRAGSRARTPPTPNGPPHTVFALYSLLYRIALAALSPRAAWDLLRGGRWGVGLRQRQGIRPSLRRGQIGLGGRQLGLRVLQC